ncbi:MAG: type VI secretion system tip protein TssI/VgrG [Polyangiaceae bacterium]
MTVLSFHRLEIDGEPEPLPVLSWRSRAALHELFAIEVLVATSRLDGEALLGTAAKVIVDGGDDTHTLGGIINEVRASPRGSIVVLGSELARLAETEDHRVVLDVDALSLAKQILDAHGVRYDDRCSAPPAPRPQRVQAFETDLAFVARLLADEGLTYLCDQDGQGEPSVVLTEATGFAPIVGDPVLPYRGRGMLTTGEAVLSARLRRKVAHDRITLRDYSFEKPELDLSVDASVGPGTLEAYRFVGPGRYLDPQQGRVLAQRALEAERAEALVLEATSSCGRLWPGRTFELEGAPRDDLDRRWLVIEARHRTEERDDGPGLVVDVRAIPADVPWRPPVAARPTMGGVTTATIVGTPGEEIHTDEHGRARARLRHDRGHEDDDRASAWSRVLMPPTTGGVFLPRTGWEALVGFSRDAADVPFVLGRLDNGASGSAEALPGKKVCSNFGTPTTPGGGSANMMRMTDTAGAEDMSLVASRDWNEQTAVNKATYVKGSITKSIGANHDLSCELARGLNVDTDIAEEIGGDRTLTAGTGIAVTAGAEAVTVGGTRDFTVGGDQATSVKGTLARAVGGAKITVAIVGNNRHVDGASSVLIGGSWIETGAKASVSVAGLSSLMCAATSVQAVKYSLGARTLVETCGARTEAGAEVGLMAGGSLSLTCAATKLDAPTVVIKGSTVTIAAGGCVLTVADGSVTFVGVVNAGGNVRSGGDAKHG